MSIQNETRRAGAAAGLGKMSFPGGIDKPDSSPPKPQNQAFKIVRRRLLVARLHRLGEAPLFHFLDEVESGADLHETLERYAALPAEFVLAHGGDRFPEPFAIRGGAS